MNDPFVVSEHKYVHLQGFNRPGALEMWFQIRVFL